MSNDPKTYERLTSKEKRIETTLDLPGDMQLSLVTRKDFHGNLSTYASAAKVERGFVMFRMGRDYHRVLRCDKTRCTDKVVRERHASFVANLEGIKADALKYYGVSMVKVEG
jgi:hypothetical protein